MKNTAFNKGDIVKRKGWIMLYRINAVLSTGVVELYELDDNGKPLRVCYKMPNQLELVTRAAA